jgi:2-iminobutanoate/2-iminopropanoate deaminase
VSTELTKIHTDHAPAAIGPYSQAIRVGNFLFASGQIPLDPITAAIVGTDVTTQTEQVMKNIEAVLRAAGVTFANVVKTTCFLASMSDFQAMNAVYARYFAAPGNIPPARSTVAVQELPRQVLVEIEYVAVLDV